jgi:hypothetical protein
MKILGIRFSGFPLEASFGHDHSSRTKRGMAPPGDARVGVFDGGDHTGNARLEDRGNAWARSPLMDARLERDIERGAFRTIARFAQRMNFRVRGSGALVEAFADDVPLMYHNGTDDRIRRRPPARFLRELESAAHERLVRTAHHD